jgi:tRNA G18 (ribose-2'-O)-methylase SpoU
MQTDKREKIIEKWGLWQRNVRKQFKHLTTEQIKKELNKDKLSCAVLMQHIDGDFNIGNIIRTSNNFNVSEIFYYGRKKWDKRASCGTYKYSDVIYLETLEDVLKLKEKYVFVGLENNVDNTTIINKFDYPKKPLFVFGEEHSGIVNELIEHIDHLVEIPSLGSVPSMNVASVASIVLYDFWRKTII